METGKDIWSDLEKSLLLYKAKGRIFVGFLPGQQVLEPETKKGSSFQ